MNSFILVGVLTFFVLFPSLYIHSKPNIENRGKKLSFGSSDILLTCKYKPEKNAANAKKDSNENSIVINVFTFSQLSLH